MCIRDRREALIAAAIRLGQAANYRSAGTVEFLYDAERERFFFLEVNTRLQVEHGVTEEVMGLDLVEWMIRGAGGDYSFLDTPAPEPQGHAIQVRLYAEDPAQDYRPTSGTLTAVRFPDTIRTETWVMAGSAVSVWYDPMLAKLIAVSYTHLDVYKRQGRTRRDGQAGGHHARYVRQPAHHHLSL